MSEFDHDEFAAIVRAGGLEDCPPEIAAEIIRLIRETKEIFARHGVTGDPRTMHRLKPSEPSGAI